MKLASKVVLLAGMLTIPAAGTAQVANHVSMRLDLAASGKPRVLVRLGGGPSLPAGVPQPRVRIRRLFLRVNRPRLQQLLRRLPGRLPGRLGALPLLGLPLARPLRGLRGIPAHRLWTLRLVGPSPARGWDRSAFRDGLLPATCAGTSTRPPPSGTADTPVGTMAGVGIRATPGVGIRATDGAGTTATFAATTCWTGTGDVFPPTATARGEDPPTAPPSSVPGSRSGRRCTCRTTDRNAPFRSSLPKEPARGGVISPAAPTVRTLAVVRPARGPRPFPERPVREVRVTRRWLVGTPGQRTLALQHAGHPSEPAGHRRCAPRRRR